MIFWEEHSSNFKVLYANRAQILNCSWQHWDAHTWSVRTLY